MEGFRHRYQDALPTTNQDQHTAREVFEPLADKVRDLVKQIDLLYKLVARCAQLVQELNILPLPVREGRGEGDFDRRLAGKRLKQLDGVRRQADEDFDFEQTLRDIHVERADLNREAVNLAAKLQENFEELGI